MRRLPFIFIAVLVGCSSSPEDETRDPEVAGQRVCSQPVELSSTAELVEVSGEHNDWAPETVELVDGERHFSPQLSPGEYAYEVRIDGVVQAPNSRERKWLNGTEYQNFIVGDCGKGEWVIDEVLRSTGSITLQAKFLSSAQGHLLDPGSVRIEVTSGEGKARVESVSPESGSAVFVIDEVTQKVSVRIYGGDRADIPAENAGLWLPLWETDEFEWWDGLMYLVFTDRFRNADGIVPTPPSGVSSIAAYQGGDFDGVRSSIEDGYLQSLGVTVLWLSPIYDNPNGAFGGRDDNQYQGYHGYWPLDPLAAEVDFGGDDALQKLIQTAHGAGIRVLFDIVLNHVHEDHIYCEENPSWCQQTCVCGVDQCDWEEKALTCQFAPYLPDLNYRNHDLTIRVVDDVLALMEKFDVDGLRIDAAKHMDHVVMTRLRRKLDEREENGAAPFYLVGETFTGDRGLIMNYVNDTELHGQFDFPLFYGVRSTFVSGGSFQDLENSASASARSYGVHYRYMSPFFGNHDVPRIATEIAGNGQGPFGSAPDLMAGGGNEVTQWDIINKMSQAFLFVLTQPGIPLIYYGDEIGLAGDADPDNRRLMPSELSANQTTLLNRVREISRARRELPALRGETREELWVDSDVYVYFRGNGEEVAFIAMSKSQETRSVDVEIPNALALSDAKLVAFGRPDKVITVIDGVARITLDPWEYLILVPEGE